MIPESKKPQPKSRFSPLFYNGISYTGAFLAFFVFLIEVFLFVLDLFVHGGNLYLGIITYVILPPFLILGLLLIPVGALWKRRRVRQGRMILHPKPFHVDLSIPQHRNAVLVFVTGSLILVMMTFVGAYQGFHYTESVEFCGLTCHSVMKPEYTAYLHSPHSRVKCVECHIGEGADHYIESKKTGFRQMVHAIDGTYKRPIETPVKSLRPAEETCERCHWPEKLFGTRDLKRSYFLTEGDEKRWDLRMQLNIGGGKDSAHGVHSHMNVDQDIYYAAEDERRQKITWVKSIDKDGKETVYVSPESKFKDSPPGPEQIRKMDCIDCHNRPTHHFNPPYRLVNDGMLSGRIDIALPGIKEKALEILSDKYATEEEALAAIPEKLAAFYKEEHPGAAESQGETIQKAAEYLKEVFSKNIFPEMKARWDAFPDNIGHLTAPGCFRCHDDQHISAENKKITQDCNACHTILEQGPHGAVERNMDGLPFVHPVDDENGWKEMSCSDCHTGAAP